MHESEVAQSCPTLCDLMDYSPPGSSVHGIFQARVLEWVAIAFSNGNVLLIDKTPYKYITISLTFRAVVHSLNWSGSSTMCGRSLKGNLACPIPTANHVTTVSKSTANHVTTVSKDSIT